ncbi:hypothetical protein EJ04DRAFT_510583 [Polyplosphaeria fusca]|uniref:Reverse transcriptase n=1 Tax=Polyplosphaeria fusca TaxID=682080 RepID=A0A9P4R5D4_9PLEO|nr:hypothetical protein EJ04DRAFT_510583 [Polyplosphaeria fusca]
MASTLISPALRQAADLKVDEFYREKEAFKKHYQDNSAIIAAGDDTLKRLSILLEGITKLYPHIEDDDDLETTRRYIEQAQNDQSVSESKLQNLEKKLMEKVTLQMNRLEVTSLHVDILQEAMSPNTSIPSMATKLEKTILEDGFEVVENELEDVFEAFEKNTFKSKDVQVDELNSYLDELFDGDNGKQALQYLREDITEYANSISNGTEHLDEETLEWCINNLISEGMINDDTKATLQRYLQSPQAIREVKSALNMKSIRRWNWKDADKGLPLTVQQDSNGRHCIGVDEDIVDLLFLHTLSISFGIKLKECLTDLVLDGSVWARSKPIPPEDMDKRDYYLLNPRPTHRKPGTKYTVCTMCHDPSPVMTPAPMPPMAYAPPPPPMVEVVRRRKTKRRIRPSAPFVGFHLEEERFRYYMRHFFLKRLPNRVGASPEITPLKETQANLIKHLATERRVQTAFNSGAGFITTNFGSFASLLPHKTILTLLKFIGMPQQWLDFFTRFLEAPLNTSLLNNGNYVVTRKNGLTSAHGMEPLLSELVLFFLDFSVHKKTGAYLYRLRDEMYVPCTANEVEPFVDAISQFKRTMGLETDHEIAWGPISIGFLDFKWYLADPVNFKINMSRVEVEACWVKKQLSACTTILEWIRVWNETMGIYAAHNFGPLAEVFGKAHLDAVTGAYNRMHEIIFDGSNLTAHLIHLLTTRFPTLSSPPFALEPLLYLPTAYGGLGVKNPYITLNLARNLVKDPNAAIKCYLDSERAYYDKAAANFSALKPDAIARKLDSIFNNDEPRIAAALGDDRTSFMPFKDFVAHRESMPYPPLPLPPYPAPLPTAYTPVPAMVPMYNALLLEPVDHMPCSDRVSDEVRACARKGLDMKYWRRLKGEERWVLQLYADECFERYGGLEIWVGGAVPMEVLRIVRGEDMDGDDDDSSSYMSEV